jgi:hypothetical protein
MLVAFTGLVVVVFVGITGGTVVVVALVGVTGGTVVVVALAGVTGFIGTVFLTQVLERLTVTSNPAKVPVIIDIVS